MTEIQKIISEYCENLYSNELKNLEEIDEFIDIYDIPTLNEEATKKKEINNVQLN
jgi:hypothetical protein